MGFGPERRSLSAQTAAEPREALGWLVNFVPDGAVEWSSPGRGFIGELLTQVISDTMYIVYECAACCFAVMIGGTFLFAIAAACMILTAARVAEVSRAVARRKWDCRCGLAPPGGGIIPATWPWGRIIPPALGPVAG